MNMKQCLAVLSITAFGTGMCADRTVMMSNASGETLHVTVGVPGMKPQLQEMTSGEAATFRLGDKDPITFDIDIHKSGTSGMGPALLTKKINTAGKTHLRYDIKKPIFRGLQIEEGSFVTKVK